MTVMPDGVIGNTSDFDSDVLSSNLSPVTDGACSLMVKHPPVHRKLRVRIPKAPEENYELEMMNVEWKNNS